MLAAVAEKTVRFAPIVLRMDFRSEGSFVIYTQLSLSPRLVSPKTHTNGLEMASDLKAGERSKKLNTSLTKMGKCLTKTFVTVSAAKNSSNKNT